jgi:signal transduction histidine kinase
MEGKESMLKSTALLLTHILCSPCAHMKYDKVFVIPERMPDFVRNNQNKLPWEQSEAFIGVPLFHEGKSFAHFGLIWNTEGAARRPKLSWAFIEMFMHSLEDMILERLLGGRGFAKSPTNPKSAPARIIPLDAITASQSLKPYARSLSHELRTPMQGVVGMLDIMHSTVLDAMETLTSEMAKSVFEELKANIEIVQESSKRAVEAADNVVHAYDMNMQMPETPLATDDETFKGDTPPKNDSRRPDIVIEGNGIPLSPSDRKRRRSDELDFHPGPPLKRLTGINYSKDNSPNESPPPTIGECPANMTFGQLAQISDGTTFPPSRHSSGTPSKEGSPTRFNMSFQQGNGNLHTRYFMRSLINECVKNAHPTARANIDTDKGEIINLEREGPRGEKSTLTIDVSIEDEVPEMINAQEQHLHFALQKIIDNAIKFTEGGTIKISIKLARNPQIVEIRVSDTGCGMTEESKQHIFKPHFQEDASISRARDGLGLSLFNAKAHVRKNLGGDVTLERSCTEGPGKGSEFLIRIPICGPIETSRPHTPRLGTPGPVFNAHSSTGSPQLSAVKNIEAQLPTPTSVPALSAKSAVAVTSPSKLTKRNSNSFNPTLAERLPLNFLVAEDNPINRRILVGYLTKLGYKANNIVQAYDGVEAVQKYKASLYKSPEHRIGAVLMDLWMPNMDGYEATEKILKMAEEHGENIVVMAVTADITNDSLQRAKTTGMKGFISKPYKVLDIQRLILEHFLRDNH